MIPPPGTCELWVARSRTFAPHQGRLEELLTPAERAQVAGAGRDPDRRRLRLSRSLLRLLLARYLELEPARIPVERRCPSCGRPHGKPRLGGGHRLQFSVAHAADVLVFAFQAATPVGVDLEAVAAPDRRLPPELVELALTRGERRRLAQTPPAERWRAFLGSWTRKEAVLKQLGTGLSTPLTDLRVDPSTRTGRAELRAPGRAGADLWTTGFDLGPAHLGAVASAGRAPVLRVAELPAALAAPQGLPRSARRW
jgi:4'-phosphopantetheinyl transferase